MRGKIRYFCFFLAAVAVMGVFLNMEYSRAETYERYLNYNYQRAFIELATTMTEIDASLQKSIYATSPAVAESICAEVHSKAEIAQMSLSQLPVSDDNLKNTSEFVNKVSDFTYSLTRSLADGEGYSEEEYESIKQLSNTASALAGAFKGMLNEVDSGGITVDEVLGARESLEKQSSKTVSRTLSDSFSTVESEFPQIPELIYDGSFSAHVATMNPKGLEGEKLVDEDTARRAAAKFTGIDERKLKYTGEGGKRIKSYYFTAYANGGNNTVQVSKIGGKIVSFINSRKPDSGTLTHEDAIFAAKNFLISSGYDSMEPTGWLKRGGTVTVSFVHIAGDVTCYPDLIKVSVALNNGAVTDFESSGYLISHFSRDIPKPEIAADRAAELVPAGLTVKKQRLAIISTDGKDELYCYELSCQNEDKDKYLIYINASTGEEERIYKVIEDENGVLVM